MLYLNKINFIKSILDEFKNLGGEEEMLFQRIYDDAQISLHMMGLVDIEGMDGNYFIVIDDEKYKVSSRVQGICQKLEKKESNNINKNTLTVNKNNEECNIDSNLCDQVEDEIPIISNPTELDNMLSSFISEVNEVEMASDTEPTPKPDVKQASESVQEPVQESVSMPVQEPVPEPTVEPQVSNTPYEFMGVIHKKQFSIANNSDPTDIRHYKITILPLSYKYQVTCTDIAVEIEYSGKKMHFVSNFRVKSIALDIGNLRLSVRGAWSEGKFVSAISLSGQNKNDYKVDVKEQEIMPENFSYEEYEKQFVREIGDVKFYILPLQQSNEPSNGLCNTVVVSENNENRQIYGNNNNAIITQVQGSDYRLYGLWDANKRFNVIVESL